MNAKDRLDEKRVASTRAPAKLNLFLELLAKRDDGFHEIDTLMVPIDWCDELRLRRTKQSEISLHVQWSPSQAVIAQRLAISDSPELAESMLGIPQSETNLVYRALAKFRETFEVSGGFDCELTKQIPAGAGMGGASSDAASALLCAAALCGLPKSDPVLKEIAASIGSDVPFFLGAVRELQPQSGENGRTFAARATGRGEQIDVIELGTCLDFVVAFPNRSLSTATVYAASEVLPSPRSSETMIRALRLGNRQLIGESLCNRLAAPANIIAPLIQEIRKSMWRSGLRACQLTGSGSSSFGIATSAAHARSCAARLRASLQPGARIKVARSTSVPARVFIQ